MTEIWIWQERFEWQGAATWMTWGWENVRFHPDIAPSSNHLAFPVQGFQDKIDLNRNLTKVKANQIGVAFFQTELNAWFPNYMIVLTLLTKTSAPISEDFDSPDFH